MLISLQYFSKLEPVVVEVAFTLLRPDPSEAIYGDEYMLPELFWRSMWCDPLVVPFSISIPSTRTGPAWFDGLTPLSNRQSFLFPSYCFFKVLMKAEAALPGLLWSTLVDIHRNLVPLNLAR